MTPSEFASTVRAKHPGSYDDIDDNTLTQKVLAKYPQYSDMVSTDQGPGVIKSGALGLMSGVPGAETAISGIESLSPDKTYEQAHQELENEKNQAWQNHGGAYGIGKFAGIVGTTLLAPEAEGLSGAAAVGAGIGGLSGLDAASKLTDLPGAAVKGAVTGAALGSVAHGVGKALESAPDVAQHALASFGKNTSLEDVQNYLNNPEAIRNALTKSQVGEKAADIATDLGKASGQMSQEARGLLSSSNSPLDAKGLKDLAMETASKYYTEGNPATASDQASINAIVDQYQKLAAIAESNGGEVPENVLRSMIDRMQDATKENTWGNPEASASQTALKEFSGKLNDALRQSNPEYAEGMAPSAELAKLAGDTKKQFALKPDEEGNIAPSDTTISKLNSTLNEEKPQGAALMDRIKNATGQDLKDLLTNAQTAENFNEPGTGLGMKALLPTLGYGLGRATGIPFGGIAGAGIGHFAGNAVDGGQIAKGIMDMWMNGADKYGASAVKPLVDKFGPVLANAAKIGGNQLAATHFVLATSNPEYQTLVGHVQGQQ